MSAEWSAFIRTLRPSCHPVKTYYLVWYEDPKTEHDRVDLGDDEKTAIHKAKNYYVERKRGVVFVWEHVEEKGDSLLGTVTNARGTQDVPSWEYATYI